MGVVSLSGSCVVAITHDQDYKKDQLSHVSDPVRMDYCPSTSIISPVGQVDLIHSRSVTPMDREFL